MFIIFYMWPKNGDAVLWGLNNKCSRPRGGVHMYSSQNGAFIVRVLLYMVVIHEDC